MEKQSKWNFSVKSQRHSLAEGNVISYRVTKKVRNAFQKSKNLIFLIIKNIYCWTQKLKRYLNERKFLKFTWNKTKSKWYLWHYFAIHFFVFSMRLSQGSFILCFKNWKSNFPVLLLEFTSGKMSQNSVPTLYQKAIIR